MSLKFSPEIVQAEIPDATVDSEKVPAKRVGNPNWKKGKSGNKAGRPKGSKNKSTLALEALRSGAVDQIMDKLTDVVRVVIARAEAGDMTAAKMLLDRAIPVTRAVEIGGPGGGPMGVKIIVEKIATDTTNKVIEGEILEEDKE